MTEDLQLAEPLVTNLELRESTPDGEMKAGLAHKAEGLVLLYVLELAALGEPRGAATIVHDAGDHGGRYLELARALARDRWAVAMPDLRGHGRSEGPRGHSAGLKEVVRDLEEVQNHLAYRLTTEPKVLVGTGLGALYALAHACEGPSEIAALVLVAPLFAPSFPPPEPPRGLKKLFKRDPDATTPGAIGWSAAQRTGDADAARAWEADEHVHDVITLRAASQAIEAAQRYAPRLAQLAVPTLVLCGADDPLAPPATVAPHVGGKAELRTYDGLRHDLLHERDAARVTEDVRAWLDRTVPAS